MTFDVDVDESARAWLEAHERPAALVIDYDVHRCCGGGKICEVNVRARPTAGESRSYTRAQTADGTSLLIDSRATRRLPRRFTLTVTGVGRWKHLDLQLAPEEWGDLLWA